MSKEKYFPKGLFFKEPHSNAPDFVKGKVSIKVDEFKKYLNNVKGEWLNIDLKISQDGKAYAEIDTWKPNKDVDGYPKNSQQKNPTSEPEIDSGFDDMDDDLPFVWLTPILIPLGYLMSVL